MRRPSSLVALALAAALGSTDPCWGAQRSEQPAVPAIHPLLETALGKVHELETHYFELGIFNADGLANPEVLNVLNDPTHPIQRYLMGIDPERPFPGISSFNFELGTLGLDYMLECGQYHSGFMAAERLLLDNPTDQLPSPEELLKIFDDRYLQVTRFISQPEILKLNEAVRLQSRLHPLGNGSMCYVVWGLLHSPAYWKLQGGDSQLAPAQAARDASAAISPDVPQADPKARWISAVLARGAQDKFSSWAALRVLNPPLPLHLTKPSRGTAASGAHRGAVGFNRDHLLWLEQCRALLEKDGPSGLGFQTQLSTKRLQEYLARMLERVLNELESPQVAQTYLRDGTLEQRQLWWNDYALRVPYAVFAAEYLRELERIVAGNDNLPSAERIKQLSEMLTSGLISPEEREELKSLQQASERERLSMVEHLGKLVVQSAGPEHFGDVGRLLAKDTEALMAKLDGDLRANTLRGAWLQLSMVDSDQSIPLLDDHLKGAIKLPPYGASAAICQLALHKPEGHEGTMLAFLELGSLNERRSVLANSRDWLDDGRYEFEVNRLVEEASGKDYSPEHRREALFAFFNTLSWRQDAISKKLLLQTFEQGRWNPAVERNWSDIGKSGHAELFQRLTPEEKADLIRRGLAAPGLFEAK